MKEIRYIIEHKLLLFLFIFIFILTLSPFLINGRFGCVQNQCGLFLGDMHDGTWFDTVSAVAFKTFPFQMPNFAGEVFKGYHFLPNLFAFIIYSVTKIPLYTIRLNIFPILYIICISILSVKVARKVHDDYRFVFLFCLFFLLGGPLRIVSAIYNSNLAELWSGYMINTFDAINIMISPNTAFSHVLLLLLINNLLSSKFTFKEFFFNIGILFLLLGTKFYTAFAAVIIFSVYTFIDGIELKKMKIASISILSLLFIVVISYFVFYQTDSNKGGAVFIWSPFSLAHHIIENPHKFFFSNDLTLQRYFLYSNTKNLSPRLLAIELYSSFVFLIFYIGIRILGLVYIIFNLKDILKQKMWVSILAAIIPTTLIPLLFIQRGVWFDTAQFLVTSSFLLSIFSAQFIYVILNKKSSVIFTLFVVALSIFFIQNFAVLKVFYGPRKLSVSQEEIVALEKLKQAPVGTVFYPITRGDSSYVSSLSEKQSFFNYIPVLDNAGIDYSYRKEIAENADISALSRLGITYLYVPSYNPHDEDIYFSLLNRNIKKTKSYDVYFKNSKVTIYKLKKI